MNVRRSGWAVLWLSVAGACNSSSPIAPACEPGRSILCAGPKGCTGQQICRSDGSGYGACDCGLDAGAADALASVADASNDGSSSSVGDASNGLTEGGSWDASNGASSDATLFPGDALQGGNADNALSTTDASNADGGSTTPDAGWVETSVDCKPRDVDLSVPPAYTPARPVSKVCTAALVEKYSNDCVVGTDCSAFRAGGAYEACGACLEPSTVDASSYGPLLEWRSGTIRTYETNGAGCIELLGEVECAKKIRTAALCEQMACAASCPVTDSPSYERYQTCKAAARVGVCAAAHQAAVCVAVPEHVTACSGNTYAEQVIALGKVFCVGP